MKSYYYLRLCALKTYSSLEEYIGEKGIITSRDDPDPLLTFDTRDEAGTYADAIRSKYPTRIVNICFHLGHDRCNDADNIKI